jgi:GNAT superfamily N-acetyltransferase
MGDAARGLHERLHHRELSRIVIYASEPAVSSGLTAELTVLRDGSSVSIRPSSAEDEPELRSFLNGLCPEARRLRFFTGAADIDGAAHFAAVSDESHYGLLAYDELGVLVGHATYVKLDPQYAEVAVEVADHLHGRGLGTVLIERLAVVAEQRCITHFVAEVLCDNHTMLDVFREGFDGRVMRHGGSEERVEFLTAGWRLAQERFRQSTPYLSADLAGAPADTGTTVAI